MSSKAKLGDWRWYWGVDEHDDEMCECKDRSEAIRNGHFAMQGDEFYIVKARMRVSDEVAMAAGRRDRAPFAEIRRAEYVGALRSVACVQPKAPPATVPTGEGQRSCAVDVSIPFNSSTAK